MQFLWQWGSGTFSTKLDVILGMSVSSPLTKSSLDEVGMV